MNNKKQFEALLYSAIGLAVMFIVVVGFNVVCAAFKQRVDMTAEKLYTLSPGTRAILKKIDTPVKVRFYCTQGENQMPVFVKTYARRIEDLLAEYRQASGGKIVVEKYDPQPDSDAEDSANLDGVEGQMLSNGDKLYLGLAISCLDAKASLPFMSPDRERLLEYDLSRAISQVITPEKPVIGVMSALPIFGQPMNPMMMRMGQQGQEPWIFITELKRDFTVKQVEITADKIDDDIKVLLVVYPKDISEVAQYAIDQYVLRGGKVFAFLDPLSIVDSRGNQMNPMQQAASSGATMDKLLKAWGIEFDISKVVADRNFLSHINRGSGRAEEAPAVLSMTSDGVNTNDVATSQIDSLLIPFAGVFTGTPAAGLTQTVLLRSSVNSQLIEKMIAQFGGDQSTKDFTPSGKEYPIAIRLTGKFKTAFPEGKPADKSPDKKEDDKKDAAKPGDSLKEGTKEGYVVLVGDADLLYDQFCAQVQNIFGQRIVMPQNGNLNFVQNITEQLAGDSDLIGVRSRATLNRPFTVVKRMQAAAEISYKNKIKELEDSLADAQRRVNELQKSKESGQRFILSPEQQTELANFRKKEAETKKELKVVRKNLRREIDSLENRIKWVNIAGMPLLVTASGITLALLKRKRTAAK